MGPGVRTDEIRKKLSESHKGKHKDKKPVGHKIYCKKYIIIKVEEEHKSLSVNKMGYEYEHRYIMEKHIGRYLDKTEVVHHKDRNRYNNNIENLELLKLSDHSKIHIYEAHITFRLNSKNRRLKRANTIDHKKKCIYDAEGNKSCKKEYFMAVFGTKQDPEEIINKSKRQTGISRPVYKKSKKVICVETGEIFDSLTKAGQSINGSYNGIIQAIKKGLKSGGKTWKYL